MDLKFLSIGRKAITFGVTVNPNPEDEGVATEERTIVAHEAPLPELTSSFAKLAAVFCEIMEFDPSYADGLNVTRIGLSYTKQGTRSIRFRATKQLECRRDYLHKMDCPMVQIDKPAEGESGEVDLKDKKHVKLVTAAIKAAEDYANGKRSQTLLNFDEAKAGLQALADKGKDLFPAEA